MLNYFFLYVKLPINICGAGSNWNWVGTYRSLDKIRLSNYLYHFFFICINMHFREKKPA